VTTLEHYAEINPPPGVFDRASRESAAFVPMAAVSEEGRLVEHQLRPIAEVAKGYTSFERGDVLMAKITPCMENGKAAYLRDLVTKQGFGSTEFHVLRPRRGVDARFLFYLIWNPRFRAEASKHMTGSAGQKRVPTGFLKQARVPLVEPSEQRRIADILDKADAIRRKRKQAISLTEELLRSAFLDMFGDPVTNPKGWPMQSLKKCLAMPLRNGRSPSTDGPHSAEVLTLSAITRGRFDPAAVKTGAFAAVPPSEVRVDVRDFLVCRGNGNVSLVGAGEFASYAMADVVFPDTMIAVRPDENLLSRAYLAAIWRSAHVRRQIEKGARTTNGTYKINQELLESVAFPLPGPELQNKFAEVHRRAADLAKSHAEASANSAMLFESLVSRVLNDLRQAS
jgi:type I restriction enzyme, S subunit